MRIPEAMIIAIYGGSGTGKTSVARAMASKLKVPLRECGEAVKLCAKSLGISFAQLSSDHHRAIDEETKEWVAAQKGICLVEGRYLNYVLSTLKDLSGLKMVCLQTSYEQRAARVSMRSRADITTTQIQQFDRDDEQFCIDTYNLGSCLQPNIRFDNTTLDIDSSVNFLISEIFLQ